MFDMGGFTYHHAYNNLSLATTKNGSIIAVIDLTCLMVTLKELRANQSIVSDNQPGSFRFDN